MHTSDEYQPWVINPDQEKDLLNACREGRYRAFYPGITLALSTGMRMPEIYKLL
jgi:hypothetical protein